MNVIACYKLTPDAEDIEVRPDRSISLGKAEWNIGEYDLMAIEAAMQIAEATGGKVSALSIGPSQLGGSKAKKDVLSRGPDNLYLVVDDALRDADTNLTARVLAAALKKMGPFDLVLCGEGSSDLYAQQVGLQLGEVLGLPTTNAVGKIEVADGKLVIERRLEEEIEVLEVPLPAVLSVTTDINEPRLPTMKEILKAGKKPVTEWKLQDIAVEGGAVGRTEILSTLGPEQVDRKKVLLEGEPSEMVQTLIGYLSREGVI